VLAEIILESSRITFRVTTMSDKLLELKVRYAQTGVFRNVLSAAEISSADLERQSNPSPSWIPGQCYPWSCDAREVENPSPCPVM
jgi:hypothetical protein